MSESNEEFPSLPGPWSGAHGEAPDPTLPDPGPLRPTTEIVFPTPSSDGDDPVQDSLAELFPHGVVVVDFRAWAPFVVLRGWRAG